MGADPEAPAWMEVPLVDQELRAYLDAFRAEVRTEVVATRVVAESARDAAEAARSEAAGARAEASAARTDSAAARTDSAAALATAEAARREADVMHRETLREIRTLGEGLTTAQSEQVDRRLDAHDRSLMDKHVAPLEASAANHERRIQGLERTR